MILPVGRKKETKTKVTKGKKSLAFCCTRRLYVCNTLVGPGLHPRYTRAPAGGGRGWASYLQNNSVRNSVRKTSIGVFDVEEIRQVRV